MKKADRSGARVALILGDQEIEAGTVGFKPLRGAGEQRSLGRDELAQALNEFLDSEER